MKALFLTAILLFLLPDARACSCVTENIPQKQQIAKAYAQASLIFTGRVTAVEDVTSMDTTQLTSPATGRDTLLISRRQFRRYTFAVQRQLKGVAVGPTVMIVTDGPGSSCGVSYAVGSERLVYAYTVDMTQDLAGVVKKVAPYFVTGMCTRTQELRYTQAAELKQLRKLAKAG
ncbi:hypothetical protein LJY25_19405 [Hymenobacter sp. BT175]|uniref:hypothetical protein n=1 Tax=Hymenobacter translucens TaxID=2886507 RepID=UPI001D0EA8B3|nr:hypothetical protein [Hymenobacter translucens]MCC2548624.1 hypothetical protein [Hymenobacter translucens]